MSGDSRAGTIEQLPFTCGDEYGKYLARLQRAGIGPAITDADVRRIVREELEKLLAERAAPLNGVES